MCGSSAGVAGEDALEGALESAVERGVDDGIDDRRRVAEPQERLEQALVDVTRARTADAEQEVDDEERRPAGDERGEHHPDHAHLLTRTRAHTHTHTHTRAVWKETAFPLWRAMERRWKGITWNAEATIIIITIRYDTRCYFNLRSKADMSQLNLPHGNDN